MEYIRGISHSVKDPEELARLFLKHYFSDKNISYPINPFQILLDTGVDYSLRDFKKLEGIYIPTNTTNEKPTVGININRPIQRQRFTAAHELCHHIRDYNIKNNIICPIKNKSPIEIFADRFASALLMPKRELKKQIDLYLKNGCVEFDDVLRISTYFGTSFEACLLRIAYTFNAISGDIDYKSLQKREAAYKPDTNRKRLCFNNVLLYEQLINSYGHALKLAPNEFMKNVFENDYVYNDSRMENVEIDIESASEIVTDLRINKVKSRYCTEERDKEAYMSIAGHAAMYSRIFDNHLPEKCTIYDIIPLNKDLFSCFPHPEYGGQFRRATTLVTGAKFETVDISRIIPELGNINDELKSLLERKESISLSTYIENVVVMHHKLTQIHPFADGNGRTLRAFFNVLLIRNGITPFYIKVENKGDYLDALSIADATHDYICLYEFFFKTIIKTNIELIR